MRAKMRAKTVSSKFFFFEDGKPDVSEEGVGMRQRTETPKVACVWIDR